MKQYFLIGLISFFLGISFLSAKAATASQNNFSITICHHTPGNNVTKTFNTPQAYAGHLGTPHSKSTFDTPGACAGVTPTTQPTTVPTVVPTVTPAPTPCDTDKYCKKCQPTVTPTPTEELTPTPTVAPEVTVTPTEEPTPTPTDEQPTPTPTEAPQTVSQDTPSVAGSSATQAPVCPDGTVSEVVANPHVLRAGGKATVNFFITKGDSANVYWKEVSEANWQNALSDVKPNGEGFVSVEIGGLDPKLGYTFGIQQKQGCGGGQIATAVIVDGPETQLFPFSFWMW